jgi:hypothetical protein
VAPTDHLTNWMRRTRGARGGSKRTLVQAHANYCVSTRESCKGIFWPIGCWHTLKFHAGDVAASQCMSRWSDKVAVLHLSQHRAPCCQTPVGPGNFPGHTLSLVTLVLLAENKPRQVGPAAVFLVPVPVSTRLSASAAKDGGKAGMDRAPMIGFLQTEHWLGPDAIMR